jgi:hypothetical protein
VNPSVSKRRHNVRQPFGRASKHDPAIERRHGAIGCAIELGLRDAPTGCFTGARDQFIRVKQDEVRGLH